MTVNDSVMDAIESLVKDEKLRVKIVNAVVNELELHGWITTDSDHLAMMRGLLRVNHKAAMDPDIPARDLAAVTLKLMSLSKEVSTLEERAKQERKQDSGGNSNTDRNQAGEDFDPSGI